MDTRTNIHSHLSSAVIQLLKPLVKLLLRYGVPFGAFSDLAKQVYVDVAMNQFDVPGRKTTVSRTSVLTGLSRKEVSRVLGLDPVVANSGASQYNRAARVIAAWVRDQRFCTANGAPAELPVEGAVNSFSELVRLYSGDVPARAILDELVRVGTVELTDSSHVILKVRSYIPETGEPEKVQILGQDVAGLISTIEHNLNPAVAPYFQRKVFYDNLPDDAAEELQQLTREHGQMFIERMDKWMAQHDRDVNPSINGTGRRRIGIGVYYFEEQNSTEDL
ncbi:MAG: DUF6502 family protein [Gammaproteobacteria bacterium]|nr:DUF6502 family protein [Gammaproteobacteria bacterium]